MHLIETIRTLLHTSNLPFSFWIKTLHTTVHFIIECPHKPFIIELLLKFYSTKSLGTTTWEFFVVNAFLGFLLWLDTNFSPHQLLPSTLDMIKIINDICVIILPPKSCLYLGMLPLMITHFLIFHYLPIIRQLIQILNYLMPSWFLIQFEIYNELPRKIQPKLINPLCEACFLIF